MFQTIKTQFTHFWSSFKVTKRHPEERENLIYIINNYPNHYTPERVIRLKYLVRLNFPNIRIKTVHYSMIDRKKLGESIGLILSGSSYNVSDFSTNHSLKQGFEEETKLIRSEYNKPILAICFGHQLAAYAFEGKVERMDYLPVSNNVIKLDLNAPDDIIPYNNILVNLNHSDYVLPDDEKLQKHFKVVATHYIEQYNTVQYMLHKERPIVSVQFHPENHISNFHYPTFITDKTIDKAKIAGEKVIRNFINLCLKTIIT